MITYKIRSTWNPEMYQGQFKRKNYFEGWYFKIVDPTNRHAFAIIPGISMNEHGEQHAFIQLLNGMDCSSEYVNYPADDFKASSNKFEVAIGDNFFSDQRLSVNVPGFKAEIQFGDLIKWPSKPWSPGIMGWYSFVPFMECYHGIVSLDHQMNGSINSKGNEIDLNGGKGYIEKDWGQSFPSSWIWMQSNHFKTGRTCITASVANIPWLTGSFIGFIAGFLHEGKLHRFATYTGAKLTKVSVDQEHVDYVIEDRSYRMTLKATKGDTGALVSPISGAMEGRVNESMTAKIYVRLQDKRSGRLLFDDTGEMAGLEVAGNYEELILGSS